MIPRSLLDSAVLEDCLTAWIATYRWMGRERDAGEKETCPVETMDAVLEQHGITFGRDRPFWLAYEREVRRLAYPRMGTEPPDGPTVTFKHMGETEADEIVRAFERGESRRPNRRAISRSYALVARTIRTALGKRAVAA